MNSSIILWIRIIKSVQGNGTFRSTHRLEKDQLKKNQMTFSSARTDSVAGASPQAIANHSQSLLPTRKLKTSVAPALTSEGNIGQVSPTLSRIVLNSAFQAFPIFRLNRCRQT
jgi:NRPS condensation-like uncharacterized protein